MKPKAEQTCWRIGIGAPTRQQKRSCLDEANFREGLVVETRTAPLVAVSVLFRVQVREGMFHRPLLLAVLSVASVLVLSSSVLAQEVNCDDFPNQAAAQQALKDDSSDPKGLDGPPGAAFTGIQGVACEELPPPTNFDPVDPGFRQILLEAGGDLPLPDKSTVVTVPPPDEGRSWPWGPATVILLSSGLLAFLVYRLIATN
jgi:hypothetical protein